MTVVAPIHSPKSKAKNTSFVTVRRIFNDCDPSLHISFVYTIVIELLKEETNSLGFLWIGIFNKNF